MKNRFRTFLKWIGLIEKNKLEELEKLAIEIKRLIQEHNQNDPINPDTKLNGMLYCKMYMTLGLIDKMKKNNPNLDWNK